MAGADKAQQEASTSAAKVQEANKGEEDAKKTLPQLGALEEDDEFEEVREHTISNSRSDSNSVHENLTIDLPLYCLSVLAAVRS